MGFDQVARLREHADRLALIPRFQLTMLDLPDQEFVEAIRRFKPLLIEEGRYRNFQTIADVEGARLRLESLSGMVEAFFARIPAPKWSFAKTFNTATLQLAIKGAFDPSPLRWGIWNHFSLMNSDCRK
jgi:hypothetical protein